MPPSGPAAVMSALRRCEGRWQGRCRLVDPDYGEEDHGHARVQIELAPEGTHLVFHYQMDTERGHAEAFDVLGPDPSGQEIAKTHFVGNRRQTQHFRIASWMSERGGVSLTLVTAGWDEARAAEFKWHLRMERGTMLLEVSRALISETGDFEILSQMKLTKA